MAISDKLDVGNAILLEEVDKFCYLGDMLGTEWHADHVIQLWQRWHGEVMWVVAFTDGEMIFARIERQTA